MINWTPERVALLKQKWLESLSPNQIARDLGIKSSAPVIRKAKAMRLPERVGPSRIPVAPPRPRPAEAA